MRPFRPPRVVRWSLLPLLVLVLLAAPAAARPRAQEVGGATFPGGQGVVAFRSNRSGDDEIWVMEPDGGNPTNLTNDSTADDSQPAWSASGTQLAFRSVRDANFEIFRMTATGEGVTRLTTNDDEDLDPAWYPSGRRVVFSSNRSGNFDLWYQDLDASGNPDGQPVQLTTNSARDEDPAVSPNGRLIAFASSRDGADNEIYVMRADVPEGPDNRPRQLTDNTVADSNPDWRPGGRQLAFDSQREGVFGVFTMRARDGRRVRPVTPAGENAFNASWSPTGRRLVYTRPDVGNFDVFRINVNGRHQTNLTEDQPTARDSDAAWQPR